MKINVLPNETKAALGFTHEGSITHEDLTETTANTTQVIDILDLTAGQCVEAFQFENSTPFEDATGVAARSAGADSSGSPRSMPRARAVCDVLAIGVANHMIVTTMTISIATDTRLCQRKIV